MSNYISLLELLYPINSIYISFDSTSPAQTMGGTWSQITGKVIRADSNINAAGSDTHYHSVSGHAALHANTYGVYWKPINVSPDGNHFTTQLIRFPNGSTENNSVGHAQLCAMYGSTSSVSTLPSYQNVYMWRRTK